MNSYTEDEYMKMILIIGTYISNMKDTLDGFDFAKEDTFDSLVELAKEQDEKQKEEPTSWKFGHYDCI